MFKIIAVNAAATCRAIVRAVPGTIIDIMGLAGVGLISYGAWLIYAPAGFIVGGSLLLAAAIVLGAKSSRRPS